MFTYIIGKTGNNPNIHKLERQLYINLMEHYITVDA